MDKKKYLEICKKALIGMMEDLEDEGVDTGNIRVDIEINDFESGESFQIGG